MRASLTPKLYTSGKRKSAVAKVKLMPGKGMITINGKNHTTLHQFHRLSLEEPVAIHGEVIGPLSVDIVVKMRGGGKEGQIQAARLAIAKALVAHSKSDTLKKAYITYDRALLVADTRRKEAYKPGDSKARSKRQKSYR